jgi:hypothetical protein
MSSIKISLLSVLLIAVACRHQERKNVFINTPTTIPGMVAAKTAGSLSAEDSSIAENQFPQNVTLNSIIDGRGYRLKTDDNKITELYIDNMQVATAKIPQYKPITDKIIKDFWIQVTSINTTSGKINEGITALKNSIEQEKKHVQIKATSIKKSLN